MLHRAWSLGLVFVTCGCFGLIGGGDGGVDGGSDAGMDVGPPVADLIAGGGCSTEVVRGLSLQIADEIGCMDSEALVAFSEVTGLVFTSPAVLPYLSTGARDDLLLAVEEIGGELRVNSGFRTVVQQYMLYQWYEMGLCGIPVAATPGSSNHESGRAVDIENYDVWVGSLPAYGWEQTVPGDPVHFDHVDSPDNRGLDVEAFQRLWNRNRPDDQIDVDGIYGPMTAERIRQAPSGGFARGPECEMTLSSTLTAVQTVPSSPLVSAPQTCAH